MRRIKVNMKTPLDKQLYSGMMEILKDRNLYHQSGVATDFNHFTNEGKEAVIEFITILAPHMITYENERLDEHSKQLMIRVLKS